MAIPEEFFALAKSVNNWGRWGGEDERGTLNLISNDSVRAAAAAVRTGKRFSLAIPMSQAGPQLGFVPGRTNPTRTTIAHLELFDADERVVRWNRALEIFYGVDRAAAIGRTLGEIFDRPFVDALRAAIQERPDGATLYRVPLNARRGDSRVLVNATAVPLHAPSGSATAVAGMILLVEDISERVRLEEQLQISDKMASIGLLAAGVAHEVNTPLTGISSFTQMLLEGADPNDPKTVLLEKIERQTFRAARIVNGLLNLARPGTQGGERIHVDLNAAITDVFALLEHQFEAAKIKVRRELADSQVTVLGIEHQLQQVFLNLFLNARDAMPRGGWLSVSTRIDGDRAIAEIADTGSGIPAEHLARIYDPFFTTKTIGRGTGLGLSITYGIVHGPSNICPLPETVRFSSSTTKRSCAIFSRRCSREKDTTCVSLRRAPRESRSLALFPSTSRWSTS